MPLIIFLYANIPQQPYEKFFPAIAVLSTLLVGKGLVAKEVREASESRSLWA